MGVISLKFANENFASLSVNDHVYFVETNTRGDYVINSNTANYLGAVKKITNSKPPITKTFTLDRDHYTNFTITNGSIDDNVGHNRLSTGHNIGTTFISTAQQTFDFGNGNVAKKGDIVTFAGGQGPLAAYTRTISSFININNELHYTLSAVVTSAGTSYSNVNFTTTSPTFKKVISSDTEGIEVGEYVSGGSLPGGSTPTTTVSSISNGVILLTNTAISSGTSTVVNIILFSLKKFMINCSIWVYISYIILHHIQIKFWFSF